ncbi:putative holin-like toxin [Streptococcus salivarius]
MSMFEVLTIMFVTGNFVISLVKLILELIKTTKK